MKRIIISVSLTVLLLVTGKYCAYNYAGYNTQNSFNKNLIKDASRWQISVDSYGSTYTTGANLINEGVADVSFTIAQKKEEDEWYPYIELICKTPPDISGTTLVVIEYKCDSDLLIKLSQKDFGEEGIGSYAHYQYQLPGANQWQTYKIKPEQFKQPEWKDEKSASIPLDLSNVDAIYLVPDIDYSVGESSNLKIKLLSLEKL